MEDVPKPSAAVSAPELKMAKQLIGQMQVDRFDADRYSDEVRARIRELIERKVEGADILEEAAVEAPRAKVIDLMNALKASLAQRDKKRPQPSQRPRRAGRAKSNAAHAPLKRAG